MAECAIRAAGRADVPALMRLYEGLASHDPAYDAQAAMPQWEAIAAHPGMVVLLAEADGVPAATCTLLIVPNMTSGGRPWAIIENVATLPAYRKRGLGRAVLAEACARAWAAGCYKISLATGSKRAETLSFYEGAGFTRGSKTFFEMRRPAEGGAQGRTG